MSFTCKDCGKQAEFKVCKPCLAKRPTCGNCTSKLPPSGEFKYCKSCTCRKHGCLAMHAENADYCLQCLVKPDEKETQPEHLKPEIACINCHTNKRLFNPQTNTFTKYCKPCKCTNFLCEHPKPPNGERYCVNCQACLCIACKNAFPYKIGSLFCMECARPKCLKMQCENYVVWNKTTNAFYLLCKYCCTAPNCTHRKQFKSGYCEECEIRYTKLGEVRCTTNECPEYTPNETNICDKCASS